MIIIIHDEYVLIFCVCVFALQMGRTFFVILMHTIIVR